MLRSKSLRPRQPGSSTSCTRLVSRFGSFQAWVPREQFAAGLRVCFSGNYALYYLHDDDAVTIVRVLHGSRDFAALAQPGGLTGGA
ncbi:MAG: type II toxin-antitoxin system RelE/ParE family toxin [Roseiarcus sp.]